MKPRRSRLAEATREAHAAGFRVADDGVVLRPDGTKQKLYCSSNGYLRFGFISSRGLSAVEVHSLGAYQWHGEIALSEGIVARHLDGSNKNNTRENIAVGTYQDNTLDIPKADRVRQAKVSWERLSEEGRAQRLGPLLNSRTREERVETIREVNARATREVRSKRTKSGWDRLSPKERSDRARYCRRLDAEGVRAVLRERANGKTQSAIAKTLGVSRTVVGGILSGKTYQDILGVK